MAVELEYGEVSAQDFKTCRIRVRLDERDGMQSYWLHVPQRHTQGTKSRPLLPELGEQVAVLLDADGIGGVYLGGIYSTAEPPPITDENTDFVRFRDGTTATYDAAAGALEVVCVGSISLQAAKTIQLQAGESIALVAPRIDLN